MVQSPAGLLAVIADGIGGGPNGAPAAQAAVAAVTRALSGSALLETDVALAIDTAHAALQPWFLQEAGGTTISAVTLTETRCVVACVGDSPVFAVRQGVLVRVTPPTSSGPLSEWLGQPGLVEPFLDSWAVNGPLTVVLCSDGVDVDDVQLDEQSLELLVSELLTDRRAPRGDDATVVAARAMPLATSPATPQTAQAPPTSSEWAGYAQLTAELPRLHQEPGTVERSRWRWPWRPS